jgi:BASS family bile acid:Na+ symporter
MVGAGLVLGLLSGGVPVVNREVSIVALMFAMTFSLTEIRFRGLSVRDETRAFATTVALNYGVLSGAILILGYLFDEPVIRYGWVVMAAVPSALAVVPLTSIFRGDVRRALVSTALLYLLALLLIPAITQIFAGEAAPLLGVAQQIFLLIVVPLLVSRPLLRSPWVQEHRTTLVNLGFLILVSTVIGPNRNVFLEDVALIALLASAAFVRTFVTGGATLALARTRFGDRAREVHYTLFVSFKNLGLAAILALALFGPRAALPAIVALFLEIAWFTVLAAILPRNRRLAATPPAL